MKRLIGLFVTLSLISVASNTTTQAESPQLDLRKGLKLVAVGGSLGERMNLYGNFETRLHLANPEAEIEFRNFCWPADEVSVRQRPSNYTDIDDPLKVFAPEAYLCFYGTNESYAGTDAASVAEFIKRYKSYLREVNNKYSGSKAQFVLVSPAAFESTGNALHPDASDRNHALKLYRDAIEKLADEINAPFVDLFTKTEQAFNQAPGTQYTVNGMHLNEQGDELVAELLEQALFDAPNGRSEGDFETVKKWVNDKSWLHLQDYRMLNGWYVYGGRRTWDTETFPSEYRKIRNMVSVRDQYIWDLSQNKPVGAEPDDSQTGEVVIPETMFGTRDDNFRKMREPTELVYPTPEESIDMMNVPDGMEVKLFASEREFPELANPNQLAFDAKGRLWVSCMPNYPQWQPGAAPPSDRLLILEDTDNDGKADKCTTFYDKLICPTGFEFYNGGVMVVDEPRILFLKDTDGDDKADEVTHLIDGIATDDTHHTMGAWEFSHGGYLHMLEGVALSTTLETPWGPFRNKGTGGAYIYDPKNGRFLHYRTPGYGNPWCLVFDQWGNGIIGDGTNAQQHWISPLAGKEINTRKTLTPVFDNQGMRPAVGNEFLLSRHLPDEIQGQFIYACVINMHGLPRFDLNAQEDEAGYEGKRIVDLLSSTDMIFRPVDPKIGPDGALWFGDWCNALIGHMQYSQRDPNRDHTHGRVYRMVNKNKPLLEKVDLTDMSEARLLEELLVPELRTRYRVRRVLRDRDQAKVFAAIDNWIADTTDPQQLCEAMWIQESFRKVDTALLDRILGSDNPMARAAAIHTITNEITRIDNAHDYLAEATTDTHPRVRLEAVRGISFLDTPDAVTLALSITSQPMDYWLDYTLEHTLHALESNWGGKENDEDFLASSSDSAKAYFKRYRQINGPGGAAVLPLEIAEDVDASERNRMRAIGTLANLRGGNAQRGEAVFKQVCSVCHQIGDLGKKFGPELSDIGSRMNKSQIIRSVLMPNAEISKGFETVNILTVDGDTFNGFVIAKDEEKITLGIADGKQKTILLDDIEIEKPMKASSMPEGLAKQIAPIQFLDLIEYLTSRKNMFKVSENGWTGASYRNPPELRSYDGSPEVTFDARIKFGPHFGNSNWNEDPQLLLTADSRQDFDFAFHSDHDVDSPYLTIRLAKPAKIKHLKLVNRKESQFHQRAEGLTVWTSNDGEHFEKVWAADEMKGEWMIDFPEGIDAKFIRIGLDGKGTFHLYQVIAFGETL
ncbi:PVC-type heme-binding CxxCH protein [Rhodopirellula sp. MGV]|uniref:PVC-type heme-binding CxxCH protein n=1 Tax=Rhodopirellula sp. MGV TaxID=2023130 RepID=UPI000B9740DE|nr:PVC-type heme-binding CxxCH protein [Rhodopirellula sp. MGV]OYP35187.1 cytochrome C [Rhodopirellula sp. MGV]PNY37799.1 cytochrome C [Rhodopirellula baltica]